MRKRGARLLICAVIFAALAVAINSIFGTFDGKKQVTVQCRVEQADTLQVYYMSAENGGDYAETNSVRSPVAAAAKAEEVTFPLPDGVDLYRFRLDLGETSGNTAAIYGIQIWNGREVYNVHPQDIAALLNSGKAATLGVHLMESSDQYISFQADSVDPWLDFFLTDIGSVVKPIPSFALAGTLARIFISLAVSLLAALVVYWLISPNGNDGGVIAGSRVGGVMEPGTVRRGCAVVLAVYVVLAAAFYWISGEQLRYEYREAEPPAATGVIGEITSEVEVTQPLHGNGGQVTGLTLYGATYAQQNTGRLLLELCVGDQVLTASTVDIGSMTDNSTFYVGFDEPVSVPETGAYLRVTAPESAPGNAVTLYSCSPANGESLSVNGERRNEELYVQLHTRSERWTGRYYWHLTAAGLAVAAAFSLLLVRKSKQGRPSATLRLCATFSRYRYLIKQLVRRDFTTKYKRSVLGMLWSLLNPLLTMAVQYVVFSRLFKSDIPNFALYLLTGIVVYNGFSEAASMALASIVGNASLITKVYVPKYIYPLTRVLASMINFLLTLIPLFVVMLITRTPVKLPILLLPLGIVCVFALALGIGMMLASAMVFFRDTQFLWGVISMLWMYMTPIIYPESIIAPEYMTAYRCNPLYYLVGFFRTILMDGVAPEPKACALMVLGAFVPLILGALVFRKTQDRFVLYI